MLAQRVDHLARLLRGVARVEVDQRVPVDLAVQDREVRADLLHVERAGRRTAASRRDRDDSHRCGLSPCQPAAAPAT